MSSPGRVAVLQSEEKFTQTNGSCGAVKPCYVVQQAGGSCCAATAVSDVIRDRKPRDGGPGGIIEIENVDARKRRIQRPEAMISANEGVFKFKI